MQIDFSAAFDCVNHQAILYRLCSVGDRPQHVMVDGCWSKLFDVLSGVPQGSVFGPVIVPSVQHYTAAIGVGIFLDVGIRSVYPDWPHRQGGCTFDSR